MKNADSRLAKLEQRTIRHSGDLSWDWENDPAFLALPTEQRAQIEGVVDKLRPHLPHFVERGMATLTLEELDTLEALYIAKFPELAAQ